MNTPTPKMMIPLCCACALLFGCETTPRDEHGFIRPNWIEVSLQRLRREVEENSTKDQAWHYSGSDDTHHYFSRQKRKFISFKKPRYYKIKKSDYEIPLPKQSPINKYRRAWHRSAAFTKRAKEGSGFTHLLSRGLVENILSPCP